MRVQCQCQGEKKDYILTTKFLFAADSTIYNTICFFNSFSGFVYLKCQ